MASFSSLLPTPIILTFPTNKTHIIQMSITYQAVIVCMCEQMQTLPMHLECSDDEAWACMFLKPW